MHISTGLPKKGKLISTCVEELEWSLSISLEAFLDFKLKIEDRTFFKLNWRDFCFEDLKEFVTYWELVSMVEKMFRGRHYAFARASSAPA